MQRRGRDSGAGPLPGATLCIQDFTPLEKSKSGKLICPECGYVMTRTQHSSEAVNDSLPDPRPWRI